MAVQALFSNFLNQTLDFMDRLQLVSGYKIR